MTNSYCHCNACGE